jgi:phytoene/squalene synthetase
MTDGEARAGEAVEHLQAAAREVIAAFRAFLDVAEEVVDDPDSGQALLDTLGDVARRVVPRPGGSRDEDGGVEHIPVD